MARLMLCASLGLGLSASGRMQPSSGALARTRLLATQLPSRQNATTVGGEHDEHEWWLEHGELLQQARREFGPLHPALYEFEAHVDEFLHPDLLEAIEGLERAAAAGSPIDERALRALLHPSGAPNVWRLPCFTAKFCEMLLEELRHYEASGIPLRRPNGMNRYGAILDALGLGQSLTYLARRFLRPLGQLLYPWLIARGDADEQYAFIVRYRRGEDEELAEHADASVLTLNALLGSPGFRGGAIAFRGTRWVDEQPQQVTPSAVEFASFAPGEAILHLGGQYHAALPIESGERANLIVWLHGKHQAVRLAPHEIEDRLGPAQRWGFFAAEPQGVEGAEESGEAVQSAAAEVTAEESVVVHASGRQQDFPDL